jgi:spore photoproduct lyase
MFSRILIEKEYLTHPVTKEILKRFKNIPVKEISNVNDIFGRVKKPYLQKRDNLQLILGKKRGQMIKEAPDAYGVEGEKHFYFIHAYNCIYECEYCYLQGYFNSPDIVLFLNHEDIIKEMDALNTNSNETMWFHAGEFSDSLALSHLTGELPIYHSFFKQNPNLKLELRTKSSNIKELLKLSPLPNFISSFSLSPTTRVKKTDLKTPSLKHRLEAIKTLSDHGHPIGLHLDPVIHEDNFITEYNSLFESIVSHIAPHNVEYISIGVVRFTHDVYKQVEKNYPESDLLAAEFITSFDKKVRYPRPFRIWLLSQIKEIAIKHGFKKEQIYLCME